MLTNISDGLKRSFKKLFGRDDRLPEVCAREISKSEIAIKIIDQIEEEKRIEKTLRRIDYFGHRDTLFMLEKSDPFLNGLSELFDLAPEAWFVPPYCHGQKYYVTAPDMRWFPCLTEKIMSLFQLEIGNSAMVVIGDDWGKAEAAKEKGLFKEWGRGWNFFSVDLFHPSLNLEHRADNYHLFRLNQLTGNWDYKNTILVILDDLDKLKQYFTRSNNGKLYVGLNSFDDAYTCPPEKIISILEPPDTHSLQRINSAVLSIIGGLLRYGYQAENNRNAFSYIMDAATEQTPAWRPVLKCEKMPDIRTDMIEMVIRALHLTNRLQHAIDEHGLAKPNQ